MENQLMKDRIDTETNQPDELVIQRFTQKFKQRREREEKRRNWEKRQADKSVDFERGDEVDPRARMQQQRDKEDQQRKDRRKRLKDIKRQHRSDERSKANSQMFA